MTVVHRVVVTEEFNQRGVAAQPPPEAPPVHDVAMPSDDGRAPGAVTFPGPVAHSAPWRQTVERRRLMLAMELEHLDDPVARASISSLLDLAHEAATAPVGVRKWWWGTEVERAWASLREAEEQILEHRRDRQASDLDDVVLSYGESLLPAKDTRLVALRAAKEASTLAALDPQKREALRLAVFRAAHAESDKKNQEARFFRNRLLVASVTCLTCAAGLLLVQSRLPKVSFITAPQNWPSSSWILLGVVMLFGTVGSLITAIPALSGVPADFSPFNLPLQQAMLKLIVGALTPVVGLMVVNSSMIETTFAETTPGLLVLAVVFGAGQQIVTKYVDSRAAEILTPGT